MIAAVLNGGYSLQYNRNILFVHYEQQKYPTFLGPKKNDNVKLISNTFRKMQQKSFGKELKFIKLNV